jgi:hypothetical protein
MRSFFILLLDHIAMAILELMDWLGLDLLRLSQYGEHRNHAQIHLVRSITLGLHLSDCTCDA